MKREVTEGAAFSSARCEGNIIISMNKKQHTHTKSSPEAALSTSIPPILPSLSESQGHPTVREWSPQGAPGLPTQKNIYIPQWLPFIVKVKCKFLQPDFKKRSFLTPCLCLPIFPSLLMLQLYGIPRSSLQKAPSGPFMACYMPRPLPGIPFA